MMREMFSDGGDIEADPDVIGEWVEAEMARLKAEIEAEETDDDDDS